MVDRNQALFERAQRVIPGGVNSPVRAFRAVGGTPRFITRAQGAYVWDAEDQRYIDYVGSWGPMILGHGHPAVLEAVQQAATRGLSFGAPTEAEIELAEAIIAQVPSVEQVRLVSSGTEAAMSAIRLARGATGRSKLIKFEGCYHGHADALLVKAGSGLATFGNPTSAGVPPEVPKLLLRGTVSEDIRQLMQNGDTPRRDWVVFSGTHEWTQGLEQLVTAWRTLDLPGWELHLAGTGPMTPTLRKVAQGCETVRFHGLLNRAENARLLCQARIGMNPQDLTRVPGSVFAFKIVEYLAAGLHVISTPRGPIEPELEEGISYVADNSPDALAVSLMAAIRGCHYTRTAQRAALETYGPDAISRSLNRLIAQASVRK
jgi:hypothetical protein